MMARFPTATEAARSADFAELRFAALLAIPGMRARARKLATESHLSYPQALEHLYRQWSNK